MCNVVDNMVLLFLNKLSLAPPRGRKKQERSQRSSFRRAAVKEKRMMGKERGSTKTKQNEKWVAAGAYIFYGNAWFLRVQERLDE